MSTETKKTKEQTELETKISAWKEKYGAIFELTAANGKSCFVKDPLSDIKIMKMAFTALSKNTLLYAQTIINNCFIEGDEEMKTDEGILLGIVDQLNEITEFPDAEVTQEGSKHIITCEGLRLEVRFAKRADIIAAEQKNAAREPFATNMYLLDTIALSGLEELKKNTRAYLGALTTIEKVKDKTVVTVKKY